jgi:hypothetical protein
MKRTRKNHGEGWAARIHQYLDQLSLQDIAGEEMGEIVRELESRIATQEYAVSEIRSVPDSALTPAQRREKRAILKDVARRIPEERRLLSRIQELRSGLFAPDKPSLTPTQ